MDGRGARRARKRGSWTGEVDQSLEQAAQRWHGVVPPWLVRGRLSRRGVQHRISTGRWRRVRLGAYAVEGTAPSWIQAVAAVVAVADARVAASHTTALRLWGCDAIDVDEGVIHVTGSLRTQVRREGVVGHRSRAVGRTETTVRHGIRCTTPARTVIDLSGVLSVGELGRVVDDLLRRRLLRLEDLRRRVDQLRSAPGRSPVKLREVLAQRLPGYDPGESPLETRIVHVIERYGFPRPVAQHRVQVRGRRFRLDFAYPEPRLFLEGNGFGAHSLASDLDRDARRQNLMVLDGWIPLVLTWRMTDAEIVTVLDSVFDRRTGTWRVPGRVVDPAPSTVPT